MSDEQQAQNNNENLVGQILRNLQKKTMDRIRQELAPMVEAYTSKNRERRQLERDFKLKLLKLDQDQTELLAKMQNFLIEEGLSDEQIKQLMG